MINGFVSYNSNVAYLDDCQRQEEMKGTGGPGRSGLVSVATSPVVVIATELFEWCFIGT